MYATYEVEGPSAIVFRGDSFDSMLEVAHALLYDSSDYGKIQNLDGDSQYDPDVNTTCEGESFLRSNWLEIISADAAKN